MHSLLLLAIVVILAPLASQIPHAVLAGILVKVGYDIIDVSYLKNAHRGPRWDLALMVLVLVLTVFVDLITAVLAGVVMGALAFVKQMADAQLLRMGGSREEGQVEYSDEEEVLFARANKRITMFDFGGPLSFGAAADLGHQVRENSRGRGQALILDLSSVPFVDVSAARAVETIGCDADSAGKKVFISGMNDSVKAVLTGLSADCCLNDENYFSKRIDAIRAAVAYIEGSPNEGGSAEIGASSQPS